MIHSHRSLLALVFVAVLLSVSPGYAHAQQDKAATDKEEVAALREKAYKLLESVAAQLGTLQSAENRARMGSNLVESLWKHDEERARSLLRLVQDEIRTELQKRERPSPDTMLEVFLKLRHDTVERIARQDAKAAFEFLKVTEPVLGEDRPYGFIENERGLEMRLAKQSAVENPEVAQQLARRAMQRGFSGDLLFILRKLNRNHREHGQTLYKEIVARVREADFDDWETRSFSQGLVKAFTPPDVDESTYRDLVGVFVTKALEKGCARKREDDETNFCTWMLSGVRDLEKYDSRAASLKHWTSNDSEPDRVLLGYEELQELVDEGSVDQLEAIASKHPELRMVIQMRLIEREKMSGNFDQARKLVDRFVSDPEAHRQLLAYLDREQNSNKLDKENLADIQTKLAEIENPRVQALFLINQASRFNDGNRAGVLKLLNQANDIIETMKPGKDQTESRLALAMMYCFEKNERGFAMMESLVPKLNELVDVAVKLDGYDTNYLRDGEWNMSADGSVGLILTQLSHRAGHFAWFDFDRAVTLASQFERPEIRMMAHLKLAQSILAGRPRAVDR